MIKNEIITILIIKVMPNKKQNIKFMIITLNRIYNMVIEI